MLQGFQIEGNIVDIIRKKIYYGLVTVSNGRIESINNYGAVSSSACYILPGFIDSHVHIESSMLVPSEFARIAVCHGTVATVSDPHEIANVLGIKGIRYMIENGRKVPFKFYFGASSCVPATSFETSGAEIDAGGIRELFEKDKLKYLSEMMNYPGVINRDPEVMEKIKIARELGKPVDGHAPGLRGEDARRYIEAGISTDHECFTLEEALDKIKYGMKIIIREGSAAKNFQALHPLIRLHPDKIMFCSDDKHPDDLIKGQIDKIVSRSVAMGYDLFDVLGAACMNPVIHYKLDVGLLREKDPADFILVNNLTDFKVLKTYINGIQTSNEGKSLIDRVDAEVINNFNLEETSSEDFKIKSNGRDKVLIRVIDAIDGQLITGEYHYYAKVNNDEILSSVENDILKIAVIQRYSNSVPSVGFIRNFGLKKGAIASCVAHDSHNIIAVGVSDEDLSNAVNAIIKNKGGISVSSDGKTTLLPLPVAGIMTNQDAYSVAELYTRIDNEAKKLGSQLHSPFMTLSFMGLLVIPKLKISDKGLFDGEKFKFTEIFL
ncbi:MAG: adenine deaminase [Ignavibacteria bacterium]|nr:adenine deaminase [Ignavibacteria bacterium]